MYPHFHPASRTTYKGEGGIGRQFANVPLVKSDAIQADAAAASLPAPAKLNRFDAVFCGEIDFKPVLRNADAKPWRDGTRSHTCADAIIELGKSGAYVEGARICLLTLPSGAKKFILQMPSSGQQFRRPFINVKASDQVEAAFQLWSKSVVDRWRIWQKDRIATGQAVAVATDPLAVTDAELDELGFMEAPKTE